MSIFRRFEPSKLLSEGKHEGKIVKVETRDEPYNYIDIFVEIKEKDNTLTVKLGCPDNLSKTSRLGLILENFGVDPEDFLTEIDLEKILLGKKISCLVKTKHTDKGQFSEIVADTLKPIK